MKRGGRGYRRKRGRDGGREEGRVEGWLGWGKGGKLKEGEGREK